MSEITQWINMRFGVHFQESELQSIKDFSLLWNVFENKVCETNFNQAAVIAKYATIPYNLADFQEILDYFKARYMAGGIPTARYPFLFLRARDNEALVRDVLIGVRNDIDSVLLVITIIIYRFRCNLFHGTKDIELINEQKENFEHANSFLMKILDQIV